MTADPMAEKPKGLLVFYVGDGERRKAVLTGPGVRGPFHPSPETPELILVRRHIGGRGEYLHAESPARPQGQIGPMFDGRFVYTSDSRFPNLYPIPVHDRFETPEQYDRLST